MTTLSLRQSLRAFVQRVCTDSEATAAELTAHLEKHPLQDEQDVGEDGTPLMVAASYGRADLLDILITAGASPNLIGRADHELTNRGVLASMDPRKLIHGDTSPLYIAAQAGHAECVSLLILSGADLNFAHTIDGSTALFISCEHGHTDCVARLMSAGAAVDQPRMSDRRTPLGAACEKGHHECARLLCARGANIDHKDVQGETPFGLAFGRAQALPADQRVEACLALLGPVPQDASSRYAALQEKYDEAEFKCRTLTDELNAQREAAAAAAAAAGPETPRTRAGRDALRRQESARRREEDRIGVEAFAGRAAHDAHIPVHIQRAVCTAQATALCVPQVAALLRNAAGWR